MRAEGEASGASHSTGNAPQRLGAPSQRTSLRRYALRHGDDHQRPDDYRRGRGAGPVPAGPAAPGHGPHLEHPGRTGRPGVHLQNASIMSSAAGPVLGEKDSGARVRARPTVVVPQWLRLNVP